jgi:hypothetical protein
LDDSYGYGYVVQAHSVASIVPTTLRPYRTAFDISERLSLTDISKPHIYKYFEIPMVKQFKTKEKNSIEK